MTERRERTTRRKDRTRARGQLTQAFKQAPWRLQIRYVGLFLGVLVAVLLIASVYLSISGQAASAGLVAYQMNLERQDLERQIADHKAQIAIQTSAASMEVRAKEMGFQRINPSEAVYVTIPGYAGKQPVVLAPPPGVSESNQVLIKSIYRQSLWDWLFTGINRLSASASGGNE
jgi:cell division protein FtsL